MSDTSLRERPGVYPGSSSRQIHEKSPARLPIALPRSSRNRSLISLPFDIILNIIEYLDSDELMNLRASCKFFCSFVQSHLVWHSFVLDSLDACRPLPLKGFRRIQDCSIAELARLVRRGHRLYDSWTKTGPKLIKPYTRIPSPVHEDVVWLSPITSKYALCCTKTGRVLCWDVDLGRCAATWSSDADWEIWKCRVEFDERTVYYAMAKRDDDGLGTDCQLMALHFPGDDEVNYQPPYFTKLSTLCFPGQVISIYLLDPLRRLLSAYIWLQRTNTLGLYVLLDWTKPLYVFLNTGISCDSGREWSCLSHDPENVVIHAEEEVRAYQFFYPLSLLRRLSTPTPPRPAETNPPLIMPSRTIKLDFIPTENPFESAYIAHSSHFVRQWWQMGPYSTRIRRRSSTIVLRSMTIQGPEPGDVPPGPNDPPPGTHLFTIAQHYFTVPLRQETLRWWFIRKPFEIVCYPYFPNGNTPEPITEAAIPLPADAHQAIAAWTEFAHGIVEDTAEEADDQSILPVPPPELTQDPIEEQADDFSVIPLVAVEFGFAAWLEYVSFASDDIRVRYVIFPSIDEDRASDDYDGLSKEDDVRTLEVPPEIDLRSVVHIGLDQAHGTVILGMRRGSIYILRYD
ncbi:hypothetical protein ACEPAG_3192 [Sanghuangporus baumii]